jgi:hypothetical protein
MLNTLTRQIFEQQSRNERVRAAFAKQHPELADELHEGALDLAHCTCPLCTHIRVTLANSLPNNND